jgi:hypothetical protein
MSRIHCCLFVKMFFPCLFVFSDGLVVDFTIIIMFFLSFFHVFCSEKCIIMGFSEETIRKLVEVKYNLYSFVQDKQFEMVFRKTYRFAVKFSFQGNFYVFRWKLFYMRNSQLFRQLVISTFLILNRKFIWFHSLEVELNTMLSFWVSRNR